MIHSVMIYVLLGHSLGMISPKLTNQPASHSSSCDYDYEINVIYLVLHKASTICTEESKFDCLRHSGTYICTATEAWSGTPPPPCRLTHRRVLTPTKQKPPEESTAFARIY